MKHLLGAAFLIAVVILIIIGLTAEEPPMTDMDGGPTQSQTQDGASS